MRNISSSSEQNQEMVVSPPRGEVTSRKAILLFGSATAYFYLLLFTLLPFVKSQFSLNPALYWFINGFFLFIPLFCYAIIKARQEGNRGLRPIFESLHLRPFSGRDWKFAIVGLCLTFLLTGVVFGVSFFLTHFFGIRPLTTTPWFMEIDPFQGSERLLLLVWLPMFFFNIVGEELIWRGYIQSRLKTKYAWPLCSMLWMVFHTPFGIDLILMLIPIVIIVPYIFHKTKNATIGIFIHGLYNGPTFVAVALGLLH